MTHSRLTTHKLFEWLVGDILHRCGIERIYQYRTPVLGLSGQSIIVDWLVTDTSAFPEGLYIECKWQWVSGSANKKLVGMPLEIKQCYMKPTLIVVDGKQTKADLKMLKKAIGGNFVDAMSLSEFIWYSVSTLSNGSKVLVSDSLEQGQLF